MGVTVAEGTEEVGVLDLLPVLLGVAATESDSDPSSLMFSGGVRQGHESERQTALYEYHIMEAGSGAGLKHLQDSLFLFSFLMIRDRFRYQELAQCS